MSKTIPLLQAKRRLLNGTIIWVSIIFLILLVQTVFGKYGANANQPWIWFLIVALPIVLAMMFLNFFLNSEGFEVPKLLFNLTHYLNLIYLFSILFILLYSPFVTVGNTSEFLFQANIATVPFQLIVITLTVVFFFRAHRGQNEAEREKTKPLMNEDDRYLGPVERGIYDGRLEVEIETIKADFRKIKDDLETMIIENDVEELFRQIIKFLRSNGLEDNDILRMQGKYNKAVKDRRQSLITEDTATVRKTNIIKSVQDFMDELG